MFISDVYNPMILIAEYSVFNSPRMYSDFQVSHLLIYFDIFPFPHVLLSLFDVIIDSTTIYLCKKNMEIQEFLYY